MNPRRQGDFGEMSAAYWLARQGAAVFIPVGHSPDYDLVAELDGRLVRIEVKTSTRRTRSRWTVQVCTSGGNQSWSGVVKIFDCSRCDYVFVHVGDGRRWFIPSEALDGTRAVVLGGPKYSEFEVARGDPIPASTLAR